MLTRISGIGQTEVAALAGQLRDDIAAAGGGAVIRLYDNNITPGPLTRVADFHQCTFTGYAPSPVFGMNSWLVREVNGYLVYDGLLTGFSMTGGTPPGNIYGWYITDTTVGNVLYAWGRFDTPKQLLAAGDVIVFDTEVVVALDTGRSILF